MESPTKCYPNGISRAEEMGGQRWSDGVNGSGDKANGQRGGVLKNFIYSRAKYAKSFATVRRRYRATEMENRQMGERLVLELQR